MLAAVGFATILLIVGLIMFKKASPIVALVVVPVIAGIAVGEWANLGTYIGSGIKTISANAAMFCFSIVFFSVMSDVGVFDVIVNKILKVIGKDPVKIAIGTYMVSFISHLDGSGVTTALVTGGTFLPIYKKMGMKKLNLALIIGMVAGIMNMVPWGGPTMRAMAALQTSAEETFTAMLPVMAVGLVAALIFTIMIGRQEKARLGDSINNISLEMPKEEDMTEEQKKLLRPNLFGVNLALVIVTIAALLLGVLSSAAIFMLATTVALIINFKPGEQLKRFEEHGSKALPMVSIIIAAGCLTGILSGTGMMAAMAETLLGLVPESLAGYLPIIVGIISAPITIFIDPDSFYYVLLPMVAETAAFYGIPAVALARAAIIGHTTMGWPVSPLIGATFMLTGVTEVEIGEHQKHSFLPLWAISIIMLIAGILFGLIPV